MTVGVSLSTFPLTVTLMGADASSGSTSAKGDFRLPIGDAHAWGECPMPWLHFAVNAELDRTRYGAVAAVDREAHAVVLLNTE